MVQEGLLGPEDDEERELPSAAEAELRSLTVPREQHGARLDKSLADLVPEFSRSYLQQLLVQGCVRLNGHTATKPAAKVKAGDGIVIELRPTQQSQAFKPEVLPLDVVYEDEYLLVINKPAGLVVHPAPGNWSGTLLNGLLGRDPRLVDVPRAGIVHRLDKDTSGLMVVARTRSTMDALVRMIAAREVSRQYIAIGWGEWSGPVQRSVQAPIGRDPRNRLRMAVVDLRLHPGKEARTDIDVLDSGSGVCVVRCTLHTGRTHQIRVHMASIRHPLVSDGLYGGNGGGGLQRQALHAFRLAFMHPMTSVPLVFLAGLPVDMQQALTDWGLRYNLP